MRAYYSQMGAAPHRGGSHLSRNQPGLVRDLKANRERLAALLHWPANMGIQFRDLPGVLVVWVDGVASDEVVAHEILKPLAALAGAITLDSLATALPLPEVQEVADLNAVVQGVVRGAIAVLVDGWDEARLIPSPDYPQHHAGRLAPNPNQDSFGSRLRTNLALIRKRLRDPDLLAQLVPLRNSQRGEVALLHMKGKADPAVVRLVGAWAKQHAGEEAAGRGLLNPSGAGLGLLPCFHTAEWPDEIAMLLQTGHVALLIDGMTDGYAAPVTAATWLNSGSDFGIAYPLKRWLLRFRMIWYLLVLFLPGALIAVLNYHADMIPTAFLAAAASARENAPMGSLLEVLLMEGLTELGREVSFRLPVGVPIGAVIITIALLDLLVVLTGFIGPLPALIAAVGGLVSLALPTYAGTFLVRIWRFYLLLAAAIFGFFGMATAFMFLAAYLCQVRRWGVPFLGLSGTSFTGPGAAASRPLRRQERRKGAWQRPS